MNLHLKPVKVYDKIHYKKKKKKPVKVFPKKKKKKKKAGLALEVPCPSE